MKADPIGIGMSPSLPVALSLNNLYSLYRLAFVLMVWQRAQQPVLSIIQPFLRQQLHITHRSLPSGLGRQRVGFDNTLLLRRAVSLENPTLDWKGSSHSTSGFVHHYLVSKDNNEPLLRRTVSMAVDAVLDQRRQEKDTITTELSADELVALGSIWYLPAKAPRDPSHGVKPMRLGPNDVDRTLQPGDYLRIHFHPRRFKTVYDYDWSRYVSNATTTTTTATARTAATEKKPGVIVARDDAKGYVVIDKPATVPVHMTVDNARENVAECLRMGWRRKENNSVPIFGGGSNSTTITTTNNNNKADAVEQYISTPQRLDQNTSGLLVVATSKVFAAYFANLLRTKTATQLHAAIVSKAAAPTAAATKSGIHKSYRCLLCLGPSAVGTSGNSNNNNSTAIWSVVGAMEHLEAFVTNKNLVRHYLEPSIRAPKRFTATQPDDTWVECLLRITQVGRVCALIGSLPGQELRQQLWQDDSKESRRIPPHCQAVVECQVELLTGRTHQIRGQLAALGFPLVGDAQYGGAVPRNPNEDVANYYYGSERLALQCHELSFVDPDVRQQPDGTQRLMQSTVWNHFQLGQAWWTPLVEAYHTAMTNASSTDLAISTNGNDADLFARQSNTPNKPARPDLLPSRISLSPGQNKYVLIKATCRTAVEQVEWFVKSSSPEECGGPYHGNVAQDLKEWIEAAGYNATVTGGGRIWYADDRAVVYGFSYGFGKGDHALAARIIEEESNGSIRATYDNRDGLY